MKEVTKEDYPLKPFEHEKGSLYEASGVPMNLIKKEVQEIWKDCDMKSELIEALEGKEKTLPLRYLLVCAFSLGVTMQRFKARQEEIQKQVITELRSALAGLEGSEEISEN